MLRPIDLQQVVTQIDQAERVSQLQHHPDRQQRYLEIQVKEERKLLKGKVSNAEESSKTLIRDEKEREHQRNGGTGSNERHQGAIEPGEEHDFSDQGSLIDIKV